MPIYRLQCSYTFTDGRHGVAFGQDAIEAASDGEAVAKAKNTHVAPPNTRLASAVLTTLDGRPIWSMLRAADARYPFARDSIEPFEG